MPAGDEVSDGMTWRSGAMTFAAFHNALRILTSIDRDKIEAAAEGSGTSMNIEIVERLERSLSEADILTRIDQAVSRSMTKVKPR